MVELADTLDLESSGKPCRFDSCHRDHLFRKWHQRSCRNYYCILESTCAIYYGCCYNSSNLLFFKYMENFYFYNFCSSWSNRLDYWSIIALNGAVCISIFVAMLIVDYQKNGFAIGWEVHHIFNWEWYCGEAS